LVGANFARLRSNACAPAKEKITMGYEFGDLAFTPAVRALQERHGSRNQYARMQARSGGVVALDERERRYLAAADSFYLATVGASGWPYVQHRGGPSGFLVVRSATQLAFADFRGNRQYVSAGNTHTDDRASMIVMDYANRQRLKLLGRLHFIDVARADPELMAVVTLPGYGANVEHVATFDVEAFDWNCPQHITPRFTRDGVEEAVGPLRDQIAPLEAELRAARGD
jgi:predicted pyridoxine 5'-phosphate oxidase superfamily flavin-nucleotide-binding protein